MNTDQSRQFKDLRDKLLPEQGAEWQRRVHVMKGEFGQKTFVIPEIVRVVDDLDNWDVWGNHWIDENEARRMNTRH
jgi:hypothetical protein